MAFGANCDNYTEAAYLELIKKNTGVSLIPLSAGGGAPAFYTYVCPLPQFSTNPQAFVIAIIPEKVLIVDKEAANKQHRKGQPPRYSV